MKKNMKEMTKDVETPCLPAGRQVSSPDHAQAECSDLVLCLVSVCLDTLMINTV